LMRPFCPGTVIGTFTASPPNVIVPATSDASYAVIVVDPVPPSNGTIINVYVSVLLNFVAGTNGFSFPFHHSLYRCSPFPLYHSTQYDFVNDVLASCSDTASPVVAGTENSALCPGVVSDTPAFVPPAVGLSSPV